MPDAANIFHEETLAMHFTAPNGSAADATKMLVARAYREYACSKEKLLMATIYESINQSNIEVIHKIEGPEGAIKFIYSGSTLGECAWDTCRGARSTFYFDDFVPEDATEFNIMDHMKVLHSLLSPQSMQAKAIKPSDFMAGKRGMEIIVKGAHDGVLVFSNESGALVMTLTVLDDTFAEGAYDHTTDHVNIAKKASSTKSKRTLAKPRINLKQSKAKFGPAKTFPASSKYQSKFLNKVIGYANVLDNVRNNSILTKAFYADLERLETNGGIIGYHKTLGLRILNALDIPHLNDEWTIFQINPVVVSDLKALMTSMAIGGGSSLTDFFSPFGAISNKEKGQERAIHCGECGRTLCRHCGLMPSTRRRQLENMNSTHAHW